MRTIRPLAFLLLLSAIPILAQTQQPAPNVVRATMDAQSAALVPKALSALDGATTITDVTLTGTVTRTAGSDPETGTITLKALGPYDSRIDIATGSGTWTEVHSAVRPHAPPTMSDGRKLVKQLSR